MLVECWIPLGTVVAVTATVNVWESGGPELTPPPHAADIVEMAMASTQSNHRPRRFLDEFLAAISPKTAEGKPNAKVPAANGCELDDGARLVVIDAALIVSVAVLPAATVEGEIPHVGAGVGPLTVHFKSRLLVNPPCAPNVRTSLADPPRVSVKLPDCAVIEKSCTATSRLVLLSEGAGSN